MPTYEYLCKECGCTFEVFQQMTDERLLSCVKCQGPLKRLIGAGVGLITNSYRRAKSDCAYSQTGRTCCGRNSPCGKNDNN